MRFPATVLILLWIFVGIINSANPAKLSQNYLKQETVDTTVMKGFYVLTEAAGVAGVGFRQQEAINTAKRLAKELREKAKGDPNARYVLWKVGELEAQIYLEERDLEIQKKLQRQITVNEYVDRYNTEVGRPRPDFSTMKKIHTQLLAIDPPKGNELADSYNKRYKSISREVIFSIEKAVLAGNDTKAREELGYCLRNKNYLSISDEQYYQIESRVDGLTKAYIEKPLIEKETDSAEKTIRINDFNSARTLIFSAQYRLKNSNEYYPQDVSQRLSFQINKINKRLSSKEDSLVNINLSILSKQGIKPADEYLQKTLKAYGVAREKTSYVDSMILMISSPEKNKMAAEFEGLEQTDEPQESSVFDNIRESARLKAQVKADSMRLADEVALRRLQAERARNDSILAVRLDAERAEQKKNQERAISVTMEIYRLVDQNRPNEAESIYLAQYLPLSKYLPSDMFDVLDMTLKALKETATSQKVTYLTPAATPSPAAPNKTVNKQPETYQLVSQIPPQPQPQPQPSAVLSPEQTLKNNQDRAQREIVGIYSMIENNQINQAYNKFQSIRTPLKKYLPKEAFDVLEATLVQTLQYSQETTK